MQPAPFPWWTFPPKPPPPERATARAFVAMPKDVVAALPHNKKGDPLEVARIAGITAAKKTSELIPLCHQIPLSHVAVEFHLDSSGVEIVTTARTAAQTGVEMEAMTAAAVAALTIYDMTKALNKAIEIREIHLTRKNGRQIRYLPPQIREMITAAILTISDSAVAGTRADASGPALAARVAELGWSVAATAIVADERSRYRREALRMVGLPGHALILTTGGTGLSARDVTPEATRSVLDREIPGIAEWMRARGMEQTKLAVLVPRSWLANVSKVLS